MDTLREAHDAVLAEMDRLHSRDVYTTIDGLTGLRPGDEHVLTFLYRSHDLPPGNQGETVALAQGAVAEVGADDDALEYAFGPQWSPIIELARRAAALTAEDKLRILSPPGEPVRRDEGWHERWLAAWNAAETAACSDPERDTPWYITGDLAWHSSTEINRMRGHTDDNGDFWTEEDPSYWADEAIQSRTVAVSAAVGATNALSIRDMVGARGFTAEHYRTLTEPWTLALGKVHPDDPL